MKKYCYTEGKIQLLSRARVAPNDLGVIRGYAVFDFLKTYHGRPFLLAEHLARFRRSAKMLDLKVPLTDRQITKILPLLLKKNSCRDASFRLVLTGGPTPDGMSLVKPNFFILTEDLYLLPPRVFARGAKLITARHQRIFPTAKTTNYLAAVKLQRRKNQRGAVEILYLSRGQVLEAATSNFFLVKNGALVTPRAGVLDGTTRNLVIKLAWRRGIKVRERDVNIRELWSADEAFITATNKDITPIIQIDGRRVATGRIGSVTKTLMAAFNDYVQQW